MFRWSYLIPRMIILGLIALAIWLGADPLIKSAMIRATQNKTGAKVEIGQIRTSLLEGKIFLTDVAIADPKNPMENLIQADRAFVKLNPNRIWHRQIVIEDGKSSHVVFGAPRTESGSLVNVARELEVEPWKPIAMDSEVRRLGQTWIDSFNTGVSGSVIQNLETVQLAKSVRTKWDAAVKTKRQRVIAIQQQLAELQNSLQVDDNNPLRVPTQLQTARFKIKALNEEIAAIRKSMGEMYQKVNGDREALLAAKTRDEQKIRQVVKVDQFEGQSLSNLLLSEMQHQNVEEAVNWFRWFRESMPDPKTDFQPIEKRGVDVAFAGVKPQPGFLIKKINLDGEGRLAGQHLNFTGFATDLTTSPESHPLPATFHLRAQGKQHLIVDCTLDRRGEQAVDLLNIQCPNLELDPRMLGDSQSMQVAMGKSRVQAEIAIKAVDQQLSGNMVFHHSDVGMSVEKLNPIAGSAELVDQLNKTLVAVDRFKTVVELSGTLDNPSFQFSSDLGPKFSTSMNQIVSGRAKSQYYQYQQRIDEVFERELDDLDKRILKSLTELSQILNGEVSRISQLQESLPSTEAWPSIR